MRMRRLWLAAICMAFLSGVAGAEEESVRVTLLGDSITNGVVTGGGTRWADLLALGLSETHSIDNIGCGGSTTTDWTISSGGYICGNQLLPDILFRERAVPSLPSDFVTIMLGTNDALGFFEPEPLLPLLYRANLEEIIDESLAAGARTVVLMSPPPQCGPSKASFLLSGYRSVGIDVCSNDPDVICGVDVLTLLDSSDFVGCDVHPTQSGHVKIYFELKDVLLTHAPLHPYFEVFQWLTLPELSPQALLPVVVYSDGGFDASTQIQTDTLTFGASGFEDSLLRVSGAPACLPLDVDEDGDLDLTCAFDPAASGLNPQSMSALLRARSSNGSAVDAAVQGSSTTLRPFPPHLIAVVEAQL